MNTQLGQVLETISTSNQWSTLQGVLAKVNKKLANPISLRELSSFLTSTTSKTELREHGIFVHEFGSPDVVQPIVLINAVYGRARQMEIKQNGSQSTMCTCGNKNQVPDATVGDGESAKKYFGSHDYNAGRHATMNSQHNAACPKWTPPTTSHLHSWRRGF